MRKKRKNYTPEEKIKILKTHLINERPLSEICDQYNCQRLHSAIGYVTPKDKLEGREMIIFAERKRKLKQARDRRKAAYQSNFMKTVSQESVQTDA